MARLMMLLAMLAFAAPAMADVTAEYRAGANAGINAGMIVRLADNGDLLIEHGPEATYLTTGGETYILLADARGRFVTRRETFFAVMRRLTGALPETAQPARYSILDDGEEEIAGFAGQRFSVGTEGSRQDRMDIVLSTAPELATLGRAVAGHIEPWFGIAPGTTPELRRTLAEVLVRGALLRFGPLFTLATIDRSPIPAERFRLPGPALDEAALIARLELPMPAAGDGDRRE
jgi:hypothetical protein